MQWLTPGLGIKRWIIVILTGTTLLGIGFAILLLTFNGTQPDSVISINFLPMPFKILNPTVKGIIFTGLGLGIILLGIWRLNRALLKPFVRPGSPILDAVSSYRRKERGPRVVAVGGGTGLSALLRGLKNFTTNLTAIVTVADDGGSSGELRRTIGILPPGDIRNCLAALSSDEALLTQIFQYRFSSGAGLNGHTLGNLLITAMADITGSFEEAVAEVGRVLAVKGRVLPSTLHDVRLVADVRLPSQPEGKLIKGESKITKVSGQVNRVWLEPDNPLAFPPAIQAILNADLIVIGPGSLFTSILPNLLVPDLAEAVKASRAYKFYVCNLAGQPGETEGYTCGDHVRMIEKHLGGRLFDLIVCNQDFQSILPEGVDWIRPEEGLEDDYPVYFSNLVDHERPWRHDSDKLAQVIMDLFYERTGPLANREEF